MGGRGNSSRGASLPAGMMKMMRGAFIEMKWGKGTRPGKNTGPRINPPNQKQKKASKAKAALKTPLANGMLAPPGPRKYKNTPWTNFKLAGSNKTGRTSPPVVHITKIDRTKPILTSKQIREFRAIGSVSPSMRRALATMENSIKGLTSTKGNRTTGSKRRGGRSGKSA